MDAERIGCDLLLRYKLFGMCSLVIPSIANGLRADGLWRHTCFEAFLRGSSGETYLEFNFSPSTEWAVYRFSAYRAGMASAEDIIPESVARHFPDGFELSVSVDLSAAAEFAGVAMWHLGLAAVVEETNGSLSYWALAHPPGKPDFHHRDGFVLALAE